MRGCTRGWTVWPVQHLSLVADPPERGDRRPLATYRGIFVGDAWGRLMRGCSSARRAGLRMPSWPAAAPTARASSRRRKPTIRSWCRRRSLSDRQLYGCRGTRQDARSPRSAVRDLRQRDRRADLEPVWRLVGQAMPSRARVARRAPSDRRWGTFATNGRPCRST